MAEISDFEFFFSRGVDIGDEVALVGGVSSPEVAYPDAPTGLFYFRSNGQIFRKLSDTGVGNSSDWVEGGGGSGSLAQALPFFLADGSQHDIPLQLGGLPFFLADGSQHNIAVT